MGRRARALGRVGSTVTLFVLVATGSFLLHMDLPVVRRSVAARVNAALASALPGRLTIERIGALGPTGVADVDAHVDDPSGRRVLRVEGARSRIATLELLRSLVSGGDLIVSLSDVRVARADVSLDPDESGALRLERAFVPPQAPPPSAPPARGVRLSIPGAWIGHATVHGQPVGAPLIDADADDSEAAVLVAPGVLGINVTRSSLVARALPGGATARGTLRAHLVQPSPDGSERSVRASWQGTVGGIAQSAEVIASGDELEASLDVPEAKPEDLRGFWPECPFVAPSRAHVHVRGALPWLYLRARVSVGDGTAAIQGPITVDDELHASLHVSAWSIDSHVLAASAPHSDLSAHGDVLLVATRGGAVGGLLALDLDGGSVGATRVPATALIGQLTSDLYSQPTLRARATLLVREPGAPTEVMLALAPKGTSFELAFDATTRIDRLEAVPRIGALARGELRARARGTVDLGARRIDAQVDATGGMLGAGGVELREAKVTAHANGPLTAPWIDAALSGRGLAAAGLRFDDVLAESHGPLSGTAVSASMRGYGVNVTGQADVTVDNGATLRDVFLNVERGRDRARAKAALVRIGAGEVRVENAEVDGIGAPLSATLQLSPGALLLRARSRGLDLARIGRLTGVSQVSGGRLALDVDASVRRNGADGRIVLDLTQASLSGLRDLKAHVDAKLEGRRASGEASAGVGDLGTIDLKLTAGEIGGAGPLAWSSWRDGWGTLIVAAHVDLAKLATRVPPGSLPFGKLAGALDVDGRLARDSARDLTPDVDLTARTTGLVLAGATTPWRIEGVDASVHVTVDGDTGATGIDAQVADAAGALAAVAASSHAVPYSLVFSSDEPLVDVLRSMPFEARLTLPERDLATLPPVLGTRGMHGQLAAQVGWSGSLVAPVVDIKASLARGRAQVTLLALPVDLMLSAHYDGERATGTLQAGARGKTVLQADASVDARAADLVAGLRGGAVPWRASGHAKLTRFPVQSLAVFDDHQMSGRASGDVTLDGWHEDARATLALTFEQLQVGDIPVRAASLQASVDGSKADASTRIDQEDGYAEAHAHFGAHWGAALLPSIDASQPAEVALAASQFRAQLLLPFVSGTFADLDGRIDADARWQIDPASKAVRPQGTVTLTEGVFELNALGGEFHDATARITLTPDGLIRAQDVSARGVTGKVEAAATARLDGLAFAGARAQLQVSRRDPLPLVVDGVQVGIFDGQVALALDPSHESKGGLDVHVDLPSARLQLPLSSAHAVQPLGPLPGVRTGIQHGPGDFVAVPLDATADSSDKGTEAAPRARIAVHLGKDVQVTRGTDLDVRLEGSATINVADDVDATGQIQLPSGTIDVQGKKFTIERGTVTFVDDPTNPQVVLTASWVAPDGTTVYADFVGPLKTGKVTLRSEPALSKNEILSLILFGTADAQAPSSTGQSAQGSGALGVAGGAAAQPINRALGGVNQMLEGFGLVGGISAKVDTSQTTPRPEVELQIARDISFQVAMVLGVPPPGANQDRTLFTLDWRFVRQWSLETTVGDAGTSILDLVWQHRY
ncbi:MAG TPA: translocation/assembly module TamB domain-containing protein [Polyangiaceae bacterium]|jgi:translocation and assembly module TamB